jgi:hypothetical protein
MVDMGQLSACAGSWCDVPPMEGTIPWCMDGVMILCLSISAHACVCECRCGSLFLALCTASAIGFECHDDRMICNTVVCHIAAFSVQRRSFIGKSPTRQLWSTDQSAPKSPVAMLAHYKAAMSFLEAEQAMLGVNHSGLDSSRAAQTNNFVTALRSCPRDLNDGHELMQALQQPTLAFTHDHRVHLAQCVSAHMKGDSESNRTSHIDSSPNPKTSRLQHCSTMYDYLPQSVWDVVCSSSASKKEKLSTMASMCVQIGLRNPDDQTCKVAVATVVSASKVECPAWEMFELVRAFKDSVRAKRELSPGPQTLITFPLDVGDFTKVYSGLYEGSLPIGRQVEPMAICELIRKESMPTRITNKVVRGKQHPSSLHMGSNSSTSSNIGNSNLSAASQALNFLNNLATVIAQFQHCQPTATATTPSPSSLTPSNVGRAPVPPAACTSSTCCGRACIANRFASTCWCGGGGVWG